jgi:hypothetical protein
MDDVRMSGKTTAIRSITVVVREFAGSRIEHQLVAQAISVAWGACRSAVPNVAAGGDELHSSSSESVATANTNRVSEGVAI